MTQDELKDAIAQYIEKNHPEKTVRYHDLNQMLLWIDVYIEKEIK